MPETKTRRKKPSTTHQETPKLNTNPSDTLWCLFGKPLKIDAVKLAEDSLKTQAIQATTPLQNPKSKNKMDNLKETKHRLNRL
jgi:hypothetical protein